MPGVEEGSACAEEDPSVGASSSVSLTTVPCHVALEDMSQILREAPSMQPQCQSTRNSQVFLGPLGAEVEMVLLALLCPPWPLPLHPWLQVEVGPLAIRLEHVGCSYLSPVSTSSRVCNPGGSATHHFGGDGSAATGDAKYRDCTIGRGLSSGGRRSIRAKT